MDSVTEAMIWSAIGEGGSGNAPTVRMLERGLGALLGAEYALCVSSGTSALIAALWAAGVRAGDAVAVSCLGPAMTGLAIQAVGARPVFLDCRAVDSFGVGVQAAAASLSDQPKAVVLVPMWGYWSEDPYALEVFRDNEIPIIVDAAQAPLLRLREGLCAIADMVCLSLHSRKPLKAGEGGACLTNHRHLAERVIALRNFGQDAEPDDGHLVPAGPFGARFGVNLKMNGLGAAWCLAQLDDVAKLRVRLSTLRTFAVDVLNSTGVGWVEASQAESVVDHGGYGLVAICAEPRHAAQLDDQLLRRGVEVDSARYRYRPMYHSPQFTAYALPCPVAQRLTETAVACRLEAFQPLIDAADGVQR